MSDVRSAFADLQKRYKIKGTLADYAPDKPHKDVPFVSQVARKPGRKMLGLFEFRPAEGQTSGSVQAIILRDMGQPTDKPVPASKKAAAQPAANKPAANQTAAKK